jgi:hypothetical protein
MFVRLEGGRDLFPHLSTTETLLLLRDVGHLKLFEEGKSLNETAKLLCQFICHYNHDRYAFMDGLILCTLN